MSANFEAVSDTLILQVGKHAPEVGASATEATSQTETKETFEYRIAVKTAEGSEAVMALGSGFTSEKDVLRTANTALTDITANLIKSAALLQESILRRESELAA